MAVSGVGFFFFFLEWDFCILVVCGSFLLWRFYPVGGVGLACQGFLVREACVSVLVCGNGFLLWSTMECSVMSFAMGLCVKCDFVQPVC